MRNVIVAASALCTQACALGAPTGPGVARPRGRRRPRARRRRGPLGPPPPPAPDAAPVQACDKMDLVFVIDDSGSMKQEQDNLRANFPMFVEVLDAYITRSGKPLDYRVAVTTTGVDVTYQ